MPGVKQETKMLDVIQIKKDYAGTQVLAGVTVRFGENEKIGLIGRNGAGKTTLLRILTGYDTDFSGKVIRSGNLRVGYVPQHFPEFTGTALDFLVEPFSVMRRDLSILEEKMVSADERDLKRILDQYGVLRTQYDALSGDVAEERARGQLEETGLGECTETDVRKLSGGERNVLSLVRALLLHPEFLILDEPGNHLDMWGLAWLEGFIKNYKGTVLVVSHNRYLLDRTVTRIIELENGVTTDYSGNYSAYRLERLRRTVSGEMAYRADRKKLERLEQLVKRFEQIARAHPDPAWGRRLHSRRTQLAKAEKNAQDKPINPDSSFSVTFGTEASRATIALKVTGFSCGFNERELLREVSLLIETGERVALVGPNGCGKTTFLNAVIREGSSDTSIIHVGPSMKVAYCSQHGENLSPKKDILSLCIDAGATNIDDASKVLSQFLFTREDVYRCVTSLSGGELNRLQLALAVIARANFLILDEPTNHLDIPAREAIEDALADFKGTILVVSHDRYFLDRIATRVVEIIDQSFINWNGNFSEFWYGRYGMPIHCPLNPQGKGGTDSAKRKHQIETMKQAETQRTSAGDIEQRIIRLEAERDLLEKEMNDAYQSGALKKARDLGNRLADASRRIDHLYEEWVAI